MNGFGTLNEYHYEVFKIVVIMIFIIQTHCHLLQLLSYKRTATNFLSAMHSKAADWWPAGSHVTCTKTFRTLYLGLSL